MSDTVILEVMSPERDSQSRSVTVYPIRLLDTITLWEREQLDVWVDVICQKIGQKVKIPVFIRLIGQKPDLSSKCIEMTVKSAFQSKDAIVSVKI